MSVHINIGADDEARMLEDLGKVAIECMTWGMPLLAMMYPRGATIEDEKDVAVVKHAARVGAELGADIVKCPYTGCPETFREVVEGCTVPVVIAGGSKLSDKETLRHDRRCNEGRCSGNFHGPECFPARKSHKTGKSCLCDRARGHLSRGGITDC